MKFNLKMIAAAAAMVSMTGAANAALATGNNGSLAIAAFNTVTQAFYIRDTGFLLNDFLPNSVTTLSGDGSVTGNKTPAAGLTLNKTNTAGFAGDAEFSNWLTGQTQSDIRWFVSAVDNNGTATATNVKRFITSSSAALAPTNGNLDGYIASGAAGGLATIWSSGSNGANSSSFSSGAPANWATNFGLDANSTNLVSLGDSVGLFYVSRSTGTLSPGNAANTTQFGNANGFATVSLAANGDFTYNLAGAPVSAVPVPAAAWLFGSGLVSFGAFARRRRDAK